MVYVISQSLSKSTLGDVSQIKPFDAALRVPKTSIQYLNMGQVQKNMYIIARSDYCLIVAMK